MKWVKHEFTECKCLWVGEDASENCDNLATHALRIGDDVVTTERACKEHANRKHLELVREEYGDDSSVRNDL